MGGDPARHLALEYSDLSCVDADAEIQREAARRAESLAAPPDVLRELEHRPHGAARVGVARRRIAEHRHDLVAELARDRPAVVDERVTAEGELVLQHGIERLGGGGAIAGGDDPEREGDDRHVALLDAGLGRRERGGLCAGGVAGDVTATLEDADDVPEVEPAELRVELGRVAGALRRILAEDAAEKIAERVADEVVGERDLHGAQVLVVNLGERGARDGVLTRDALDEDEAPGVEIRLCRGHVAAELLRRAILGRAHELVGPRDVVERRVPRLERERADAEIEHLHVGREARAHDHDVGGLEIPVDDAGGVGCGEGVEHLTHDLGRALDGELAFAVQQSAQRLARHELVDSVVDVVRRSPLVEQADDVGVPEPRAEGRLALEPRDLRGRRGGGPRRLRAEDLDGHLLPRIRVDGAVNGAEATAAELVGDFVVRGEGGREALREPLFTERVLAVALRRAGEGGPCHADGHWKRSSNRLSRVCQAPSLSPHGSQSTTTRKSSTGSALPRRGRRPSETSSIPPARARAAVFASMTTSPVAATLQIRAATLVVSPIVAY
jgi:hypothetical protein